LEPVTGGLATQSDIGLGGTVGSDAIVLPVSPADLLGGDGLLGQVTYTSYGVALSHDDAASSGTLAGSLDSILSADSNDDAQGANITLPGTLDDLNLRGLGDGIV
jgi:hypothetical protein